MYNMITYHCLCYILIKNIFKRTISYSIQELTFMNLDSKRSEKCLYSDYSKEGID